MDDTKDWSGDAHTAATKMFERAEKQTDAFSAYTTAVGDALKTGADRIGSTRTALLNKADEIDMGGQLHVSDQWVVLITGAQMTAEQAAALERRAQAEQVTVNGLLLAVGTADDDTAATVTSAAQHHGFDAANPGNLGGLLLPGMQKPDDEVPNPSNPVGFVQQATLRDTDMAQTVRDTKVEKRYDPETGKQWGTTTTIYKQDGSKHVKTVNTEAAFSDRGPATTEKHYDKGGNLISESGSVTYHDNAHHSLAGAKSTTTTLADATVITLIERPNGTQSGTILTPDGRQADVPINLFDHPVMSSLSAGASGLPGPGGKYGGPAISVATALWDVAVADSGFEKCVATAEGATSVATGTLAGLATSGATPWLSIPFALAAAGGGEAVGNWVGNTFCPR